MEDSSWGPLVEVPRKKRGPKAARAIRAEKARDRMFGRRMENAQRNAGGSNNLTPEAQEFFQKYQSSQCNTVKAQLRDV